VSALLKILEIMLTPEFGFTIIRVVVPILFAALGAYIANRAGIPNIAMEGIMLMAAFVGTVSSSLLSNHWLGLIIACLTGIGMALVLAYFTLVLKTNNILGGIALNLFSTSFSVFLLFIITGSKGTSATLSARPLPRIQIPLLKDIPILGRIFSGHNILVYIMFLAVILVYVLIYQTPLGLRMKAVGKDPLAAESVGINVRRTKTIALALSGLLAALGGAYMSMGYLTFFTKNMTAGRGFIGLAAEAMGHGNVWMVTLTALLFGMFDALSTALQLFALPPEILQTIPYVAVFVGIVIYSMIEFRRAKAQGDE